jgi:hypothetical protein
MVFQCIQSLSCRGSRCAPTVLLPFHGGNTGSIPVGRASDFNHLALATKTIFNKCSISGVSTTDRKFTPPHPLAPDREWRRFTRRELKTPGSRAGILRWLVGKAGRLIALVGGEIHHTGSGEINVQVGRVSVRTQRICGSCGKRKRSG